MGATNLPVMSVIVPVYKVEDCLAICVESIMLQTLSNIEIILVNDGSPDECPRMCDNYADVDPRVMVIHKENGGLSQARNVGLRAAKGRYVLFVDSDDYIVANSCEQLAAAALKGNLDIVCADAVRTEGINVSYLERAKESEGVVMTGREFLEVQLFHKSMHMPVCLNLYNRDFLLRNSLFFKEGILHEDEQWTPRVFLKAERVQYVKLRFYNYVIRVGSITKGTQRTKNGKDLVDTCFELDSMIKSLDDSPLKLLMNEYIAMLYLHAVHYGDLYNDPVVVSSSDFFSGKVLSLKNKLKVALFLRDKRLYKAINNVNKRFSAMMRCCQ